MNNEANTEAVLWSESSLIGNPLRKSCHPAMLSDKGYEVTLYPKVRKKDERTEVRVKYDRTFIAEKFVKEFMVALGIDDFEKFIYLLRNEIKDAIELAEFDEVSVAFAENVINELVALDSEAIDDRPF